MQTTRELEDMILNNKGLVYKMLHKFHLIRDPEAESLAFEALYKAAKTYDANKPGTHAVFATYASVCIYNKLGCYVRWLNRKRQIHTISYNAIAYTDDSEGHEHLDFLSSNEHAEDKVLQNELVDITRKAIKDIVDNHTSSETSKLIIRAYVESEYTLDTLELGKIAGVSQSYASYALNVFKNKLKRHMEEYYNA